MALPKLQTTEHKLTVPSTQEEIKFRPFLVKEQKILLLAAEEATTDSVMNGITQILQNCTFGKIEVSKLPVFEVENLFLRLREKSVGEVAEFNVACTSEECNGTTQTKIDLRHIQLDETKIKSKTIKITDSVFVNMRYPTLLDLKHLNDLNSLDDNFKFLASCIDSIEYNGEIIDVKTTPKEELQEFIENLTQAQFELIKNFFAEMPRMSGKLEYDCAACGTHCERELSGLQNFLA